MNDAIAADAVTIRRCVELIKEGALTSEQLITDYLNAIDATETDIGAWVHLDRDFALRQAKAMDDIRRRGKPLGDLHGIPIGIKDIFDTKDLPTERGTPIYAGRKPESNSAVVEKLYEAGAVILGKTVTTEFAYMQPAGTRNPHNLEHSPGGSSSGSAAAVAAGHIPLAIGSQTNGSTIRPASFCGIYGFKPSRGIISRRGVLRTSGTLDQVGTFGRDLGDLALLCDVIGGYDVTDDQSYLSPRPRMLQGFLSDVPVEPSFAWFELPYADRFSEAASAGCEELIQTLGARIDRIPAPRSFSTLLECQRIIQEYEIYRCLQSTRENHWESLSETMKSMLDAAGARTDDQYREARNILDAANTWFQQFFYDYDAIISPSALGEATAKDESTGDPICCSIWTLCGLPCISLPLLTGKDNLPIGVQMIAGMNEDDRLLRTSRWLLNYLRQESNN